MAIARLLHSLDEALCTLTSAGPFSTLKQNVQVSDDDESTAFAHQQGLNRNEPGRNERGPPEDRGRDYGTLPRSRDLREPMPQSLMQHQPRIGRSHPHREYRHFLRETVDG